MGDRQLRYLHAFSRFGLACLISVAAAAPAFASGGSATIQQPADGAVVSGIVAIALTMAPRVASANIYLDGSLYASAAPANLIWDSTTATDGEHVISVKSFSSQGRFLGGQAVMVTVQNGKADATPTRTATPAATPTADPTDTATPVSISTPTPTPVELPSLTVTTTPTIAATPVPTTPPTTPPTFTSTPTAAPTPPAVVITSPLIGTRVEGTISFAASKSSNCQWMNFYVDGVYVASSPPSAIFWDSTSVPDGPHTLSVAGFDSSSNMIANPAINVIVDNVGATPSATPTSTPTVSQPTAKPTATIISPTPTIAPTPSVSPTPVADPLRPSNDTPNNRMPSAAELAAFHNGIACGGLDDCRYMESVNGQFSGTTAQIIEALADKWCLNCTILNPLDGQTYSFRDLLKAVAVNETNWREWKSAKLSSPDPITGIETLTPAHGDLEHVTPSQPNGGSWGLFQIAEGAAQGWPATFPLSAESTAFNADFKIAEQMGVEQGQLSYLADASRSIAAISNGFAPYVDYTDSKGVVHPASSDVNQRRWGAVGNWYSGGWYDSGAIQYIDQVQQILHDQPWTLAGF
jgi:hypothetical protein